MPRAQEITQDYSPAAPERVRMVLVAGTGPPSATDLRALLQRRLRFLAMLFGAAMAVLLLLVLSWPGMPWYGITLFAAILFEAAALAGLLWWLPTLSVRQLRAIELILFGTVVAFWALVHAGIYPTFRLAKPEIWFGSIMAHAISLPWALMILLYGIFIPNTWRRCAGVVSIAVLTPLLICLVTGIAATATRGHGQALFWVPLAAWLATAAAFAIYGSHRIELLRQEASAVRRLGQYVLRERLGAGGMGEVYRAEHVLLRRPCALKLIRQGRAGDPQLLLRFEREVQATAALTHPNTVQIFDYGHAEDGTFYYTMEYLIGLNLEELVKRHGPLPPQRAIHLLRQVCGALQEAHAAGLIHRDIKPSNIIACTRGGLHDVAKLLDFGLVQTTGLHAAGTGNLTHEGTIAGTPAYMSPEQADGTSHLTHRCDLYSLGAVAYYLLTGQPPFPRPSPLQMLIAHVSDAPVSLDQLRPEVPADLQAIVLRCLAKDPTARYADARSLDLALGGCVHAAVWTEEHAAAWWQQHALTTPMDDALAEAATIVTA